MRAVGDHVLLADQLAEVGDRLQEAHRPDAVGPVTGLHAADQLALEDRHEREERHQAVREHERLDHGDEHSVGHYDASFSMLAGPSTGAPSQAKRTAPGAERAREADRPGRRAAGVPHGHMLALGDAEPLRVRAGDDDLVAALERELLGAHDGGAREQRPPADGVETLSPCSGSAARAEPARGRGGSRPGERQRGVQADRLVAQAGEQRRGGLHARECARRARLELELEMTPGGRQDRQLGCHAVGRRQRTAAGAGCGPRGSSSCRPSRSERSRAG